MDNLITAATELVSSVGVELAAAGIISAGTKVFTKVKENRDLLKRKPKKPSKNKPAKPLAKRSKSKHEK